MILKSSIYLDNSQTTKPSERVVNKMIPFFTDYWGIYSQPTAIGQELENPIKAAVDAIKKMLNANENDTLIFTASGAEAVNQIILGYFLETTHATGKNHYLVGKSDEAPAIMSVTRLEQIGGIGGLVKVDKEALIDAITPRTAMLSLSLGNGLTGTIAPLQEILPILKERGVKLHLDVSHAAGKLLLDINLLGADFISFDGGLIHGPKSSGALLLKGTDRIAPLITGGLEQGGFRGAPLDTASLVGLGEAAKEAVETIDLLSSEGARLRQKFERGLRKIPLVEVLFTDQERLPHITCAVFEGVPSEMLLYFLNKDNFYATMGGGNLQQIGFVLSAFGIPSEKGAQALSFSLSRQTTEEEIERALVIIEKAIMKVRKLSEHL